MIHSKLTSSARTSSASSSPLTPISCIDSGAESPCRYVIRDATDCPARRLPSTSQKGRTEEADGGTERCGEEGRHGREEEARGTLLVPFLPKLTAGRNIEHHRDPAAGVSGFSAGTPVRSTGRTRLMAVSTLSDGEDY